MTAAGSTGPGRPRGVGSTSPGRARGVGSHPRGADSSAGRHGEAEERTYRILRELIVTGDLAPGERAVEVQLAHRIGVSRTPVRSALARLAREGYLVPSTTGRRIEHVVAPLTADAMRELWGIVGALEGLAIGAIEAMGGEERGGLAEELQRINRDLETAAGSRPPDAARLAHLQGEFHCRFMERCAGPQLRALYEGLRPHVRRYEWAYGRRSDALYAPSIAEHHGILEAVSAGDGAGARALLIRHWERGAERTAEVIAKRTAAVIAKRTAAAIAES